MGKKRVPAAKDAAVPAVPAPEGRSHKRGANMAPAAYARHRGVSRQAVDRAIREGRIPVRRDGRIGVAAADAAWDANTAPRPAPAPRAAGGGPPPASRGGPGEPPRPPVDLTEARTMHEYAKAQLAELELGVRSGQLVTVADVRDAAFRCGRSIRDLLLTLEDRLSEVLVGASDAAQVRRILSPEIRRALDELAALAPPPAEQDAGDGPASAAAGSGS